MENKGCNKLFILVIIGLIAALVYTNLSSRHSRNISPSQITKTIIKSDTTLIVDTVTKWYPKPIEVKVVDTMYIHSDSIEQSGDSILLPRETKTYEDSTYRAIVSGYKPSLDTLMVYPRTYTIEKTKTVTVTKKQHWSYGVGVGFGYGMFNKKFDVFIGGTVGYTF